MPELSTARQTPSTLVLGASPHPHRYAYLAVLRLQQQQRRVQALGIVPGYIGEVPVLLEREQVHLPVDTVSVYLRPARQQLYEEWLIGIKPRRVIFNPGAENPRLASRLATNGIEVLNACTLVMLSTGMY